MLNKLSKGEEDVIEMFRMKLVSLDRLRVEMEDWKTKSNKMTMDLNKLNAQYREMEAKVT